MLNVAQHTIFLQDGTLCNFKKRFETYRKTLFESFKQVKDGRGRYGRRHTLPFMLLILFGGITSGSTTLKDCHLWALHNRIWLKQLVHFSHGIPDPTTIARAIQKVEMDSLVTAYGSWQEVTQGKGTVASFDGKTLNGVHGEKIIKHVLSLFTHETHQILGQVGVEQKENEIPAAKRLFDQTDVSGMLLLGDALHTQTDTAKTIIEKDAEYLLVVKENQNQLMEDLRLLFSDNTFQKQQAREEEYGHNRYIQTEIILIKEKSVIDYFTGWEKLSGVGMLKRRGERKDQGVTKQIDETVYFITSKKDLTAKKAGEHLRNHWQIENNLHWQKDYTFLEDRQTLRRGNAPLVMTFLRSICISLFASFSFSSVSTALANFQKNPSLHHAFLTYTNIV